MSDEKATAYHEAGHVVMYHLLRRKIVSVTLGEQEDTLGMVRGHVPGEWFKPDLNSDARTRSHIENKVLICAAGDAAEFLFTGAHNDTGASGDFSGAVSLASYLISDNEELEAYLNWLWIRSRNMLKAPQTWPLVEALANALLDERPVNGLRMISGRRAKAIIKQARLEMIAKHLKQVA